MCEFCVKHGEGKKWYLEAKNYSDDLLSDARRRKFIEEFFSDPESLTRSFGQIGRLDKLPRFVRDQVSRLVSRRMKKIHYGQVLPIEEVEKILDFVGAIVRISCVCRSSGGKKEKRYCYGISLSPRGGKLERILAGLDKSFFRGPDGKGIERLTKEEALAAMREHEEEGCCHTVWTFHAPFIGGICNCDRADCLAVKATVTHGVPVMFRAEYVAQIDPDKCNGCRSCMRVCQFGAIGYSASDRKAIIDQRWCYGCGICRAACKKDAIRLEERAHVPAAAKLW